MLVEGDNAFVLAEKNYIYCHFMCNGDLPAYSDLRKTKTVSGRGSIPLGTEK